VHTVVVRMLCLCKMEVTCVCHHEVFRTDISDNVSASLYRVHQGKVIHICVLAWYRSGIIQRIWTVHLWGGEGGSSIKFLPGPH
jgi:hypothetical protein